MSEVEEETFLWIDPDEAEPMINIRAEEDNPEEDPLYYDIMENGVLQNIRIRPHPNPGDSVKYEVYAGRRRLRIVKTLKEKGYGKGTLSDQGEILKLIPWRLKPNRLPAILKNVDDLEAETATITENINRKDVRPAEIGNWIKGMLVKHREVFTNGEDREPTQKEIADYFNRSQGWVSRMINAAEMEKQYGIEIPTTSHYRTLAKIPNVEREELISKIKAMDHMPPARELQRRMKADKEPVAVLERFPPEEYAEEFVIYQLMEECGLDTRSAKLAILEYKSKIRRKTITAPIKPDNTYTRLAKQYPLWMQNLLMEYLADAKTFDTLQNYAVSLIRLTWNEISEEEQKRIVKKWVREYL